MQTILDLMCSLVRLNEKFGPGQSKELVRVLASALLHHDTPAAPVPDVTTIKSLTKKHPVWQDAIERKPLKHALVAVRFGGETESRAVFNGRGWEDECGNEFCAQPSHWRPL